MGRPLRIESVMSQVVLILGILATVITVITGIFQLTREVNVWRRKRKNQKGKKIKQLLPTQEKEVITQKGSEQH